MNLDYVIEWLSLFVSANLTRFKYIRRSQPFSEFVLPIGTYTVVS